MSDGSILEDLLGDDLEENRLRVLVETVYDMNIDSNLKVPKDRTIGPAKNLKEFYDLVNRALIDYQSIFSLLGKYQW